MEIRKMNAGIIGCGNISDIYLSNLTSLYRNVDLLKCADIDMDKARLQAEKYSIKACTVEELLNSPKIDIIINLTIPAAHAGISLKALDAGKHVYSEKPLAVELEDGMKILAKASEKGLYIGCSPDTFMGGGIQTSRKLIDEDWIGRVVGASVFMGHRGPETWHPNPAFLYHKGAGPLFDIGPYYITALVSIFGPVKEICSSAKITYPERIITSEPLYGDKISVEEPSHVTALLKFESGVDVTLTMSFDVFDSGTPKMEVYGKKGTLIMPDPNTYGGPVLLSREAPGTWREMPMTHAYLENSRGLGVSDIIDSIESGVINRANGEMAYHVLEVMHGILISSREKKFYQLNSRCSKPLPMSMV